MPARLRATAVWLVATGALAALVVATGPTARRAVAESLTAGLASRPFDALLVQGCAVLALPAAGWLWLLTTLVVLEALGAGPREAPGVPGVLRRAVLVACGVAVIGASGPARADPDVAGLPLPDRATGEATLTWLAEASATRTVVVRPGDSLWSIATADLPPSAGADEVAAYWHRIYRLNRAVVGADPDLIHPHQRLLLPPRTDRAPAPPVGREESR